MSGWIGKMRQEQGSHLSPDFLSSSLSSHSYTQVGGQTLLMPQYSSQRHL